MREVFLMRMIVILEHARWLQEFGWTSKVKRHRGICIC